MEHYIEEMCWYFVGNRCDWYRLYYVVVFHLTIGDTRLVWYNGTKLWFDYIPGNVIMIIHIFNCLAICVLLLKLLLRCGVWMCNVRHHWLDSRWITYHLCSVVDYRLSSGTHWHCGRTPTTNIQPRPFSDFLQFAFCLSFICGTLFIIDF